MRIPPPLRDAARKTIIRLRRRLDGDSLFVQLHRILHRLDVNCVLDVGAHYGEYGRILRALGYRGRIVSFEPVRANVSELQKRASRDSDWAVRHLALGNCEREMTINVPAISQFSSFLPETTFSTTHYEGLSKTVARETVRVARLEYVIDDCLRGIRDPRVLLKLDTQGFDLEVLKGAGHALEVVLALQSELSVTPIYEGQPDYLQALAFMADLGFTVSGLYAEDRAKSLAMIEMDCLMVRDHLASRA